MLKLTSQDRSRLAMLCAETKLLFQQIREVEIAHCYREQNRVAHMLANCAIREMSSAV
uniref:RNase H type-1 domain-containing protein n=1 Tax=Arundo donax TaxID=35708 RepID=A0A0A8ZMM4_ARUDO